MTDLRLVGGQLLPPATRERRHLLSVSDLTRGDVERILSAARSFADSQERETKKLPTLRGRVVLNVFYESSTRTSSSFELAAKRLSADTVTLRASGSSVDKGESLKDTALTLSAYDPDVIVLRHPEAGAAEFVARFTDARVVNAGDGKHQHPTQALLDLYTLRRRLWPARRSPGCDRRRRRTLACGALARPGAQPRRFDSRFSSGRLHCCRRVSRRCRTTSRRSPTSTSSTCSGCSASGCSRARTSCRRSASTAGVMASPPHGSGPVSSSCTRARSIVVSNWTGTSPTRMHHSCSKQVQAGLVVRMAILYDLLTAGPVAVEATVETA